MSAPKAFGSLLRRALQEHQSDESGPSDNSASSSSNSNDMPEAEFNPRLFWGINIFLFLLALSVCCCCWRFQRYDLSFLSGGGGQRESAVLERRRAAEERREETPEKRQAQLAASFARNKVTMVRSREASYCSLEVRFASCLLTPRGLFLHVGCGKRWWKKVIYVTKLPSSLKVRMRAPWW